MCVCIMVFVTFSRRLFPCISFSTMLSLSASIASDASSSPLSIHVAEAMDAAATNIERPGDDRNDNKRIDDDCIDDDRVDARLRLGEREEGVDGA